MLIFKFMVSMLVKPLVLALLAAVAGGVCHWLSRRRVASWLLIAAAAIAYLGAIPPVGNALLAPLENAYPPLGSQTLQVDHVVVLGSGYTPRKGIPVTAALDDDGLARVVEGIRLERQRHIAHLVLSGGSRWGEIAPAQGYARLASELGVPAESIVILDKPVDTAGEAKEIVALLGQTPFILVTSAYHMRRAVALVEARGGRPIPAPTGHRADENGRFDWGTLLPSASGLRRTERALHEYVALLAMAIGAS